MESKHLNDEQISFLKDYIRKRGFINAIEIQEILDHFACKVEEVLELHPTLNLQQAMHQAHTSFGVKGFEPLVAAFKRIHTAHYRKTYFATLKASFMQPKWLLLVIASVIACYQIISIPIVPLFLYDYSWSFLLVYMASTHLINWYVSVDAHLSIYKSYFYALMPSEQLILSIIPFLFFINIPSAYSKTQSLVTALLLVYMIIERIAYYQVLKKMKANDSDYSNIIAAS